MCVCVCVCVCVCLCVGVGEEEGGQLVRKCELEIYNVFHADTFPYIPKASQGVLAVDVHGARTTYTYIQLQ